MFERYPGTKQCLGQYVQVCALLAWENDEDCAASGSDCAGGIWVPLRPRR